MHARGSFAILICLVLFACGDNNHPFSAIDYFPFQNPDSLFPADNHATPERIELGRLLFHDTRLSIDNSVSCASCHKQEFAFADNVAVSPGVDGRLGDRNAPTLGNVLFQERLFMEGGAPSLETQILTPISDVNEMAHSILKVAEELKDDAVYKELAMKAYNRAFDPYVITRSISAFERTLISNNSDYDKDLRQPGKFLSEAAMRGKTLFFSEKANCGECHSGPNFTDGSFENIGLSSVYEDPGRYRYTIDSLDIGKFKTPSLRNVELTSPYMHDGSIGSLMEVLEHFNSGGKEHPNKSKKLKKLNLSKQEMNDIVEFLKALTDEDFISNPALKI